MNIVGFEQEKVIGEQAVILENTVNVSVVSKTPSTEPPETVLKLKLCLKSSNV